MASEVDLYNMALSRVGISQTIGEPNERTEPARICRRWFDHCRDECLRNFPWSMARKAKQLALLDQEFPGYAYVYQYPSDCLFALAVIPEEGLRYPVNWLDIWQERINQQAPKIAFERALRADGNSQVILTDLSEAWLLYIARVTTTSVWDVDFVNMLAWRLAMEVGPPLKADARLVRNAMDMYEAMRGRATANDFNEGYPDAEPDAPSVAARG
ncbi:MAG TPA: hypothetical protein VNI78_02275 [Vicinamibacterales bacterium]|nr:hypothetical protein [Vicinamibacterales bacterium]